MGPERASSCFDVWATWCTCLRRASTVSRDLVFERVVGIRTRWEEEGRELKNSSIIRWPMPTPTPLRRVRQSTRLVYWASLTCLQNALHKGENSRVARTYWLPSEEQSKGRRSKLQPTGGTTLYTARNQDRDRDQCN